MPLPAVVTDICREAVTKFPMCETAINVALEQIMNHCDYDVLVSHFVRHAIEREVYNIRHQMNYAILHPNSDKNEVLDGESLQSSSRGNRPPIRESDSPTIRKILNDRLNLFIHRKTLGMLLGKELIPLAEREESEAKTHKFKAALLRRLRPHVGDNETVEKATGKKKNKNLLDTIWDEEQSLSKEDAA